MAGKQLKEFKASGENSEVMDPVDTGPTDRPKDKKYNGDPMVTIPGAGKAEDMIEKKPSKVAPKRFADKTTKLKEMVAAISRLSEEEVAELHSSLIGEAEEIEEASVAEIVKEDFDKLFGKEYSEEFRGKAFTIFEAAVLAKVIEETDRIEEEYALALEQMAEEIYTDMAEQVEEYLETVAEEWLDRNQMQVESTMMTQRAESFMESLRDLLEEHYFEVPEEASDVVEELVAQVEALEEALSEALEENEDLVEALSDTVIEDIVAEVTEGMSMAQKERFSSLAENLSYRNVDELKEKLEILKETNFGAAPSKKGGEQQLNEEYNGSSDEKSVSVVSDAMAAYIQTASKLAKNK